MGRRMTSTLLATALTLVAAWSVSQTARADSLSDVFTRGNTAFARGEYAEAVKAYETLVESGIDDADVCYDLASAYGSLGKYGQAIRYFERSLRLDPGDDAARAGLKASRAALGERQAQARGEAIVVDRPPLTEALFSGVSSNTLATCLLIAIWLSAGLFLALPSLKAEALRLGVGIASALLLALAVVSAIGVGAKADWGRAGERAVILRDGAAVREAPDEGARLAAELFEGDSVRVTGQSGAYARIVSREQTGYVRREDVGEI